MSDLIAALDSALAEIGEDFVLRRVAGVGASVVNVDVTCRGRIDAMTTEEIAAGIKATDLSVVFSPTQINNAQWPGGRLPQLAPFNVDQRVPRENGPDKVVVRGSLRTIARSKPFFVAGELVRIEMRVTG